METEQKEVVKSKLKKHEKGRFVVETKEYKETFGTFEKAKNQLEILKKGQLKNRIY